MKRLSIRISEDDKNIIATAAYLSCLSLSEYIRRCVINEANKKIKNSKVICLNNKERDCFLYALNNPPQPNKNLVNLFK